MLIRKKLSFLELCICKHKRSSVLNNIEKEMASLKEGGGTKKFGEHEKTYKMNLEGF